MQIMDVAIDRVRGTKTVHPTFSYIFREGDRVYCYNNHQRYFGEVVEVMRDYSRPPEKNCPEILMRADNLVDTNHRALLGGYGLRGGYHLFHFEDETREEVALHTRRVEIPLTSNDLENLEKSENIERAMKIK